MENMETNNGSGNRNFNITSRMQFCEIPHQLNAHIPQHEDNSYFSNNWKAFNF